MEKYVKLIRDSKLESIEDYERLILDLGLNDEFLNEQPPELSKYFGKGLKLWQYPNQLSKFGKFISSLEVSSYMEIGCRFGGTFIYVNEILRKNNQLMKSYACDLISESDNLKAYHDHAFFTYMQGSSRAEQFKQTARIIAPEFVFIDGDHSYEGVLNDYLIFENFTPTKYIAFHDIDNSVCPGVVRMWSEVKNSGKFNTFEFNDQYDSVKGNFLGIGLAVRK